MNLSSFFKRLSLSPSLRQRRLQVAHSTQAGFSLIEIIIVLGILGTLIAVLVGGLGEGSAKAKIKETGVKAGNVTQNLLKYQSDVGKMPTTAEGLGALLTSPGTGKWAGPYGAEEDTKDAWDISFEYELTPKGPKLVSAGPDGQIGTEDDITFVGGRQVDSAKSEGAPAN
jgi:general secretion pathway protein G